MVTYIIRRILFFIPVLLMVAVFNFVLMRSLPGGPMVAMTWFARRSIFIFFKRFSLNDIFPPIQTLLVYATSCFLIHK